MLQIQKGTGNVRLDSGDKNKPIVKAFFNAKWVSGRCQIKNAYRPYSSTDSLFPLRVVVGRPRKGNSLERHR